MTTGGKIVLTGLALGAGALALGGGSKTKKRPAYKKKIPTVPNDVPWTAVDEAICQCWNAGDHESVKLVNCSLARIWPEVPWPHQPGDSVSVLRVWQAVGARVATFMVAQEKFANGEGDDPCAIVEPPPPPPPGEDIDITDYFGDAPRRFVSISQTHNQDPSHAVANAYGLAITDANVGRALVCMSNVGINLLLYSRKQNAGHYGSASVATKSGDRKNYDIGDAWFPWHNRVQTAATTGQKLHRQVGWSGNSKPAGGDHAFGSPWMPPTTMTPQGILVCTNADPWAPENNPPAEVLAKLGWTLDEMKTAWLNGNP